MRYHSHDSTQTLTIANRVRSTSVGWCGPVSLRRCTRIVRAVARSPVVLEGNRNLQSESGLVGTDWFDVYI